MSEEQGYIRVVNIKGDEDHRPAPDEKLVMMDRTNKVLGIDSILYRFTNLID